MRGRNNFFGKVGAEGDPSTLDPTDTVIEEVVIPTGTESEEVTEIIPSIDETISEEPTPGSTEVTSEIDTVAPVVILDSYSVARPWGVFPPYVKENNVIVDQPVYNEPEREKTATQNRQLIMLLITVGLGLLLFKVYAKKS